MSRQSAASKLKVVSERTIDGRPPAPGDLTPDQQRLWDRVVAAEPADFFQTPATQQLLRDYCRHVTAAEFLSEQIDVSIALAEMPEDQWPEGARPRGLSDMEKLMRMRNQEARGASEKATKLRLTNQSRYGARSAATAGRNQSKSTKPWH